MKMFISGFVCFSSLFVFLTNIFAPWYILGLLTATMIISGRTMVIEIVKRDIEMEKAWNEYTREHSKNMH